MPTLEPFDKTKHKMRDVFGHGDPSTEYTITVRMPDGTFANIPSIWWDEKGDPTFFGTIPEEGDPIVDGQRAIDAAIKYEKDTGLEFQRYTDPQTAGKAAALRSRSGGGNTGPLATKPKADTSWITDDMLDALAWQESKFDPMAESSSGAKGMYQWMPAFWKEGKEVGFGVPKGPFDPTDPVESRKRTKAYLEGMQKYYPNWDPTEVLMAYNWGHNNVKKFKSGELEVDPYDRAFNEALNYAPLILQHMAERPWEPELDERAFESSI